jgi:outer membrane protein assembly factor BamA
MAINLKKYILIILLIAPLSFRFLEANNIDNDTIKYSTIGNNQKDIYDLLRAITKSKKIVKEDSSKKDLLGPFYTIIPYPGYAMVTGFLFGFVSNVSFLTHKGNDAKVSSILMSNIYSQYKQFMNIINSNIWLDNEKINLTGDWRFYKFPTYTYGLGSKTSLSNADAIDYSRVRIYEVVMGNIAKNLFAGIGYNLDYYGNITELYQSPANDPDYDDRYGLTVSSISSGISLNVQYDDRLNSNNPEKGTYVYVQYRDNRTALGSTNNWTSLLIDARHYIQLSKVSGNVLAFWSYDWFTLSGMPPYLDLPATGEDSYNNTARGYIEGRFRGLNLLYAEAEYRFRLLKSGLLGGVLFSNASTVSEFPGNKFERINPGNGIGLRVKMNKSASTNLCIDYGIGTGGSRGFSFNLNEVF